MRKISLVIVTLFVLGFLASLVYGKGYALGQRHNGDYKVYWVDCSQREEKYIDMLRSFRAEHPIQGSKQNLQPAVGI